MELGHQEESPEIKVIHNSREAYLSLLNKSEIPDSPKEMPSSIFLLPELLGDLNASILATNIDHLERLQWIDWDSKNKAYKKGNLFIGNPHNTGGKSAAYGVPKAFFGRKAVVEFHIHPSCDPLPSIGDVVYYATFPRKAFIDIIGSKDGIVAILQTRQSEKLPFSVVYRTWQNKRKLKREEFGNLDWEGAAQVLNSHGFAFYWYVADTEITEIKEGDLAHGVSLYLV